MSQSAPESVNKSALQTQGSVTYVVLLALVAALGGLLFGYDTAVISGAIGFLQYHFNLDPQVAKGWAAASALIGCAVGAAFAGLLSDRLGRKKVLILCAIFFFLSAVGTAWPRTFGDFVFFRIIGGLAIGAASLTSPMYIAEISPARIRGRMVSVNQFAIVTGMMVVYFVNYFIAGYGSVRDRAMTEPLRAVLDTKLPDEFVQRFIADRATVLDGPAEAQGQSMLARLFAEQHGPEIERQAVEDFLSGQSKGAKGQPVAMRQSEGVTSEELAAFLKQYGVEIDRMAVDLARRGAISWNVDQGWRWMFASGTLPALLLLVLLFLVPESPRWLTKQGSRDQALAVLARISGAEQGQRELADIEDAIAHESGSLAQLFQPGMRAAFGIGVALAVLQQVTGINVFLYFAPEIFKKMGSGTNVALLQTVLVGAVNLTFTVIALWTVDRWGRKPLMVIGTTGMGVSLLSLGLAAYFQQTDVWVVVFILTYIGCFALSVGPVTWVILSEIFPTRIRGRAMGIATVCLWLANFVVTQTFTMMDESPYLVERFHHAFPFWVYTVLCAVSLVFVLVFVPETKGKTLEEIERSWVR